ncbi:MAG: hypothetical protein AAGG68_09370 [Bacteroidota bacterium]
MAKSKKEFNLSGLQNLSLDKKPDIEKAVEEVKPKAKKVETKPKAEPTPAPKPKPRRGRPPKSEQAKSTSTSEDTSRPKMKSTSFKIEEDLHRSLKEYSFFEEINMADYIFDLVKEDLKDKGYYPPRKRKKR